MNEKYLSESAWKALVSKHKLKDTGLGKALAGYGKRDEKDFKGRLASLDEIEKAVATLQKDKAVKENEDVTDYLDEVKAEAPKTRKAVEAAKKAAEEEESEQGDEEEGGADAGAIKKKLLSLLAQVRTKAPDDPQLEFMAAVAKGASAVLLAKKAGSAQKKALLELMPGVSGPKFYRGECRWEENAHTFVLETVPGGLSKRLQKALLAETGAQFKVRVRSFDGLTVADSETEEEMHDAAEGEASPPAPPQADGRKEEWLRLKARVAPKIKQALAANPALKESLVKRLGDALQQEKVGAFAEAIALFTKLHDDLAQGATSPGAPPPPPPNGLAALQAEMSQLVPRIKELLQTAPERKNELLQPVAAFQAEIKAAHEEPARALLEKVRALLEPGGGAPPAPSAASLRDALAGWEAARAQVIATLRALEKEIRAMKDPESDAAIILIRAVSANLTATPDTRRKVTELQRYLQTDRIISDAESPNGFGIQVAIRDPLLSALREVAQKLPQAA